MTLSPSVPQSSHYKLCPIILELIGTTAVMLYHVWPSEFGNGFMGVDILFVAWGFLLGNQLLQSNNEERVKEKSHKAIISMIVNFVWAPFKSTFTMYMLTICSVIVGGIATFFEEELIKLRTDSFWAVNLGTNYQLNDADWNLELLGVPQKRPLYHLWACAVYLQFCAIFAILFIPTKYIFFDKLVSKQQYTKYLLILLMGFLALSSHIFWLFYPSKAAAIGWTCSRAWQFLIGSIGAVWSMLGTGISSTTTLFTKKRSRIQWISKCQSKIEDKPFALEHILFYLLIALLCIVFFLPSFLWPSFLHFKTALAIVLSISAMLALYLQSERIKEIPPCCIGRLLINHFEGFSLVFYLVHLPFIVLFKHHLAVSVLTIREGLVAIPLLVFISIAIHQTIYRLINTITSKSTILMIIALCYSVSLLFCIGATPHRLYNGGTVKSNLLLTIYNASTSQTESVPLDINSSRTLLEQLQIDAYRETLIPSLSRNQKVKINEFLKDSFAFDRFDTIPGNKSENFTKENGLLVDNRHVNRIFEWEVQGSGTDNLLIFGNSHAQIWTEILALYKGKYRSLRIISVPSCMPLFVTDWRVIYGMECSKLVRSLLNTLERNRPDTLFLIFKWYEELQTLPFDEEHLDYEEDETLKQMQHFLDRAQEFVAKRIYLNAPNLFFPNEIAYQLTKRLWQGAPVEELHKSYQEHLDENRWSLQRMKHLRCPKCTILDFTKAFCDGGMRNRQSSVNIQICMAYDPDAELAYFSDSNHLSYLGRLKAMKYLEKIINI